MLSGSLDTFAKRLKSLRAERRISRDKLAKLVGVSKVTIWHWERGDTTPRVANLEVLADALEVSPDYLELGTEDMAPGDRRAALRLALDEAHLRDVQPGAQALSDVLDEAKRYIAQATGIDPAKITVLIDY